MLCKIAHEGGAASANRSAVLDIALRKLGDIHCSVLHVFDAEVLQRGNGSVVGVPQLDVARPANKPSNVRPGLQLRDECAMGWRHIVTHLNKVGSKSIIPVLDAQGAIKAGPGVVVDNRALLLEFQLGP